MSCGQKANNAEDTASIEFFSLYKADRNDALKYSQGKISIDEIKTEKEAFLSIKDIDAYSWERGSLYLNEKAVAEKMENRSLIFVFEVNDKKVYLGGFWPSLSSESVLNNCKVFMIGKILAKV